MATLTDAKDLQPYLGQMIPLVRVVLVDPVPEARATAARALGGLVERLGEDNFPELIPSLLDVLQSDSSGVDQQGAAQGLAEILGGLGVERLEDLLPDILSNTSSTRAYVREGYISLLVFLPSVFGDRFAPYLGRIIQPILTGLADDSDYVRDASMRAGRMIVSSHSNKAIDLLLPELERGLFDSSWRIRQSSIQLVGELLFRIVGITAKADIADEEEAAKEEEEERHSAESSKKALLEILGKDRRDRILSSIYIVRQDPSGLVRKLSIHVWKALVQNTPRTIREILPSLVQLLVRSLSTGGREQRETASRTLGELCRKLGESILGEILPIIKASATGDESSRIGACMAYVEVMNNTTKQQLEPHEEPIISAIRKALVDESADVRKAAAEAFDSMQRHLGARAIDQTVPSLLQALDEGGSQAEAALAALEEVMAVRANVVVPVLVPKLTKQPITFLNAKALTSLVSIANRAIGSRIETILAALTQSLAVETDEATIAQLNGAVQALFSSLEDSTTLNSLMLYLFEQVKQTDVASRVSACQMFGVFCEHTSADYHDFHIDWLRQLVALQNDYEETVVNAAWTACDVMVKNLPKEQQERLAVALRRAIENTTALDGRYVAGFSKPNGLKPFLPILLQGLTAGTAEQREQAAYGFGDLVERTSPDNIRPFVPQIAGPLIRIVSERVPPPVKSAILSTLNTLLVNIPTLIRPFFPQIQRTFTKNLADLASPSVRNRASIGLGSLMAHQPRIDPLITELMTGLSAQEEPDIRDIYAATIARVVASGGKNLSADSKSALLSLLEEQFEATSSKEAWNLNMARLFTALLTADAMLVKRLFIDTILKAPTPTNLISLAISEAVESAPSIIKELDLVSEVTEKVERMAGADNPSHVSRPARQARELIKEQHQLD